MILSLHQATAPAKEPVTLDEAKTHLRMQATNLHDDMITALITTARQAVEAFTRRSLISQDWEVQYDPVPREVTLPRPPVSTVTKVAILTEDGNTQELTIGEDVVVSTGDGARVRLLGSAPNGHLEVSYTAGYGEDADAVPSAIRHAILVTLHHLYDNPATGAIMPEEVQALLGAYKWWLIK